jgi:hypothetical protein
MSTVLLVLVIVAGVAAVLAVPAVSLWASVSLARSTRDLARAAQARAAELGQPPPPEEHGEPEQRPAA